MLNSERPGLSATDFYISVGCDDFLICPRYMGDRQQLGVAHAIEAGADADLQRLVRPATQVG